MADLSHEAMVEALHPSRLPEAFVALNGFDFLAAFGLGLVLAALVMSLAQPFLQRRPRLLNLKAQLAQAADLGPDARERALLRLLEKRGLALPDDIRQALYQHAPLDPKRLEDLLRRPAGAGKT